MRACSGTTVTTTYYTDSICNTKNTTKDVDTLTSGECVSGTKMEFVCSGSSSSAKKQVSGLMSAGLLALLATAWAMI